MERQKLMRMTERSERMYLQEEKRGREIHPVTPCGKLPRKASTRCRLHGARLYSRPWQEIAPFLQIMCVKWSRTRGKRGGELGVMLSPQVLQSSPSVLEA